MQVVAAVARDGVNRFSIEAVELCAPRADELLVEIVAVGLCHSDLVAMGGGMTPLPAVLGHEGAGIVRSVGAAVTRHGVGDHVLLSYASCGSCVQCRGGLPAGCGIFGRLNMSGGRPDGSATIRQGDLEISGSFFGQSSFASHVVTRERNAVAVDRNAPLHLLAPLCCGVQTGAGAIMHTLECQAGSTLLVTGGGSVGLSAVMAAVIRGCSIILVSEPSAARRSLALELGATHVHDPALMPLGQAAADIAPAGFDSAFDSTGRPAVIEAAIAALGNRGVCCLAGVAEGDVKTISIPIRTFLSGGRAVRGTVAGDGDPQTFIPELIALHKAGRLPLEKLVRTYPFREINRAVSDQAAGLCVKPVLTWS